MKECPKCKSIWLSSAEYCPSCGHRFKNEVYEMLEKMGIKMGIKVGIKVK